MIDYSFSNQMFTLHATQLPQSNCTTTWSMKNAWHFVHLAYYFSFTSVVCFHFSVAVICLRKCANLLYFVIGHKSVKRHNRLLIRSKLANWICMPYFFFNYYIARSRTHTQDPNLLNSNAKSDCAAHNMITIESKVCFSMNRTQKHPN